MKRVKCVSFNNKSTFVFLILHQSAPAVCTYLYFASAAGENKSFVYRNGQPSTEKICFWAQEFARWCEGSISGYRGNHNTYIFCTCKWKFCVFSAHIFWHTWNSCRPASSFSGFVYWHNCLSFFQMVYMLRT